MLSAPGLTLGLTSLALGLIAPQVPPSSPAAREEQAQPPDTPAAIEEQSLRFEGAGGFQLQATFTQAAQGTPRPAPAVLLIPERGRVDRNGNRDEGRTQLGAQLAVALAREGVASLRFDRRTTSTYALRTGGLELEQQRKLFAWTNLVADAGCALDALASREEVDPQRIGIVAHGGGAYIALELATRNASEAGTRIAALALLAAPTAGWDTCLRRQVGSAAGPPGSEERRIALEDLDQAMAAVVARRELPGELMPFTRLLFHITELDHLDVELAYEPLARAREFPGPMLALSAEVDPIVPPDDDGWLALGERLTFARLPGVGHDLKEIGEDGEQRLTGPLAEAAREQLAIWVGRVWPSE